MKLLTRMAVAVVVLGCKNEPAKQTPTPAPKVATSCPQQTEELKTWLQGLFDGKPTTAPWPTGDAAFDAELTKWRDRVREASKPMDPSQPRPQLEEGRRPGLLEQDLAGCEPAKAQLAKVAEAAPAEQAAAWIGLADAIAACDCKPNIAHVKASLYVMQRGPD